VRIIRNRRLNSIFSPEEVVLFTFFILVYSRASDANKTRLTALLFRIERGERRDLRLRAVYATCATCKTNTLHTHDYSVKNLAHNLNGEKIECQNLDVLCHI